MEKFTKPVKKQNILLKIIEENLNISIKNPDKFLNEELSIVGKEKLIEKIEIYFENYLKKSEKKITANLKGKSLNFVNEKYLDIRVKNLKSLLN